MVNEKIRTLECSMDRDIATVNTCNYFGTGKRGQTQHNYSTYKITLSPTIPANQPPTTLSNEYVNSLIDILDDYFSGLKYGQLHIKDNTSKPYSAHKWAKFTNILISCINNYHDRSYGPILGICPETHGRHHKTCNWIL